MPATRPRASFEPIAPDFEVKALVESTPNFFYVDRISCETIEQQGLAAFERLILVHVVVGGKPLVIDGFEERLDPWTFTPKWLRDNCGDKHENARDLTQKQNLELTLGHYLRNMGMLTNQFFNKPGAHKDMKRQRIYLKDIDCPPVWQDKLREHIPSALYYLNESTGEVAAPGTLPDARSGRGIGRAGDLMSSLPPEMRAENLMCYIGHEGTYTPAHREMCASLGHNIMVEASTTFSPEDGKPEKPGSSIWFMTESKDRQTVSEYWLSVLGHDIEVENHFAQVVAWKKAPFNVYIVEQRPGDFILIPPLAPHQVWNRGTRTMKVAWNRTTVETLEMALNEALPRSRIVCRDEQYKNKAIIYYSLQKYSSLLTLAMSQATQTSPGARPALHGKARQLFKDFKRLFKLYRQMLLAEMFSSDDAPKSIEYLPFDGNVTCAYCRGNIFNRFLSCPSCKDLLGHHSEDSEGDPYDVCLDCYAMGRSCACISNLKWVEQFRWKELASKYESWRKLIIAGDGGQVTDQTPLSIIEERKRYGKKTLAEVCKEQLKRRPWKDVKKKEKEPENEDDDEEIVVDDNGMVKKTQKKRSKAWLNNHTHCHVCKKRHPNWKMAQCTTCDRMWCYGVLFKGWDKMPIDVMENAEWSCAHCLNICFAGSCKSLPNMEPYEPRGTLLGHDTRKVADVRSVEVLVDFSQSNLNWLKEDLPENMAESRRLQRAGAEAQKAKELEPNLDEDDAEGVDESRVAFEDTSIAGKPAIDPALDDDNTTSYGHDADFAQRLRQATSTLPPPTAMMAGAPAEGSSAPDGYASVSHAGRVPPAADMYPQPDMNGGYSYPGYDQPGTNEDELGELRPLKRTRVDPEDEDAEDISMSKHPRAKKTKLTAAGFRSADLADDPEATPAHRSEAQRQFEKEKVRKALETAKAEGRFVIVQAALRKKRRIVKLPISSQRLEQFVAAQAAKAALHVGEDMDAEHDVDEGAAQQLEGELEDEASTILLKSDIVPKQTRDHETDYERRQKEGRIISGNTTKAVIPIDKDEKYDYQPSRPRPKGRVSEPVGKATNGRSARKRRSVIDREEINITSDEDVDNDEAMEEHAGGRGTDKHQRSTNERRPLPSYLQNRNNDEEDAPHDLPPPKPGKPRGRPRKEPVYPASVATVPPGRPTAGKRPNMRPSSVHFAIDADEDDAEDTQRAVDAAANGDFMDVDQVLAPSGFTTVNQPAVNGGAPRAASKTTTAKSAHERQTMDEQNRLAKLQALEMVTGGTQSFTTGKSTAGMADAVEDDESEDEDGVEQVPAGR